MLFIYYDNWSKQNKYSLYEVEQYKFVWIPGVKL